MKKAIVRRLPKSNPSEFASLNVLARVLCNRGIDSEDDIQYSLRALHPPQQLAGLDAALELLYETIVKQKTLCVIGDFDADGATSTALCIKVLRAMGLQNCSFLVPNRFEYGYGLSPEIVDLALAQSPDILLTVDNGISSIDGVAHARANGLQVIVTDHHLPGATTPNANAIVNPNQQGCEFPSKNLAGVGVAFYLLSALRTLLRERGWFASSKLAEPNMADFLDLVALGTVADVVPLDKNNRILVDQGLKRIRAGKACAGIQALLYVSKKNAATVSASDIGFAIGPRLNAAGRLDDMSLGIQCLLSSSSFEAEKLAANLNDLNQERRAIETGMQAEAVKLLDSWEQGRSAHQQFGICLYEKTWHEGVIGILASRIKERLHRPTIIFAQTQGGQLKGSGRSIAGVHLRDVLDEIATANPGLLNKFGGHAMAAGLSIDESSYDTFVSAFDGAVAKALNNAHPEAEIETDGALRADELNLHTAIRLRDAGPWGQGFPEPVFDGTFTLVQHKVLKDAFLKFSVTADDYSGQLIEAICFNYDTSTRIPEGENRVRLVYKLDVNEYRGNISPQLLVEQFELLEQ